MVGAATSALRRKDLICAEVGASPFRLTPTGETFLKPRQHAWATFLAESGLLTERLAEARCRPVMTGVGVTRLAFPELMVEIEATAMK